MAVVIWDLCQPDRRRWKGAGIGLAAAIKLVPLIFILYLLLTRRVRAAAAALVTFVLLAAVGFAALPQASWQWWFGADFLRAGRTGFVGFLANQSLRGLFTRESASLTSGLWWWLAAAAAGRGGRADHRRPAAPGRPAGVRLAHLRAHRSARVAGQLGSPLGMGRARARGARRRGGAGARRRPVGVLGAGRRGGRGVRRLARAGPGRAAGALGPDLVRAGQPRHRGQSPVEQRVPLARAHLARGQRSTSWPAWRRLPG